MQAACWSVLDNSNPPAPPQMLQAELALLVLQATGGACLACKLLTVLSAAGVGACLPVELDSQAGHSCQAEGEWAGLY